MLRENLKIFVHLTLNVSFKREIFLLQKSHACFIFVNHDGLGVDVFELSGNFSQYVFFFPTSNKDESLYFDYANCCCLYWHWLIKANSYKKEETAYRNWCVVWLVTVLKPMKHFEEFYFLQVPRLIRIPASLAQEAWTILAPFTAAQSTPPTDSRSAGGGPTGGATGPGRPAMATADAPLVAKIV